MAISDEPLCDAISSAAIARMSEFQSRDIASPAWACAKLTIVHAPLRDALSSQAIAKIGSFEPLDIATTAWAYDTLKLLAGPLMDALAAEALRKMDSMENQPLATLVDIGLPGCAALEQQLTSKIVAFAQAWSAQEPFAASNALLFDWQVDNFGIFGTALLLEKFGVFHPRDVEFEARALRRIGAEDFSRSDDWRSQRFFHKERVYCYSEYRLGHPGAASPSGLQGQMVKENSFQGEGTRAGRTGLLRSMVLPINELVDRTLCAEFQALSELCDLVDSAGVTGAVSRQFLTGDVRLWTSGASCLSCVGIMRQFVALFPRVVLEVLCSKRFRSDPNQGAGGQVLACGMAGK
mmetsp:Transcript_82447/g.233840  ORF Transcript_82447/g.233840 Transcript_82447/m.233840 type:complete len:350 (-) Transcript_82447:38-1087(-)